MKILKKLTNGIIILVISALHTQFCLSSEVFGKQFQEFSSQWFFKISNGLDELPIEAGKTNLENFSAFWFFYFGIMLIPIGILLHTIERDKKIIPNSFTISYLIVIIIGSYMIPNSGMTFIMLPHAVFMLVWNFIKIRRLRSKIIEI